MLYSTLSTFGCISIISLLSLWANVVHCLVEDYAKEQACFDIKETTPIDATWLDSLTTQYYPVMSLLDFYRLAREMFTQADWTTTTKKSSLLSDSCIKHSFGEDGSWIIRGFQGRHFNMEVVSAQPGFESVELRLPYSGMTATCHTTLTDNSTFYFMACCHSDNQMSWGVGSALPKLSKETVSLIHEHAASLGFKKEYFAKSRYELCGAER